MECSLTRLRKIGQHVAQQRFGIGIAQQRRHFPDYEARGPAAIDDEAQSYNFV